MSEYKLFINGDLVDSRSGKRVNDIGPASGEPIAQVPESSLEDVERAVAAAREAFDDGRWSGLTPSARAATLDRKSTRLNSSPGYISYAVFCLKKKSISRRVLSQVHTQKILSLMKA